MRTLSAIALAASFVSMTASAAAEPCDEALEAAQVEQQRGKIIAARKALDACAAETCSEELREQCASRQAELDKSIATLAIVVREASGKNVEAQIKVDGAPWSNHPTPIDPGEHVVEYTIPGMAPVTSTVSVQPGEKAAVVMNAAGKPPPVRLSRPDEAVGTPSTTRIPLGALILGGVGVVALGFGVGFYIDGNHEKSVRDEQLDRAVRAPAGDERDALRASAASHQRSAEASDVAGLVIGAAGLGCIAGAVTWYLLARPGGSSGPAGRVTPLTGPRIAGLAYATQF